ncbi:hypothetical protein B0H67DRAFT_678028 [Lasiosphaeris hirsuta]|uniref:Uncharacterized protein n=1 Tax=Lasiosphaeris hirsuta TaxID=260670 RepID=A0AA40B9K2_9PEZI|nr:hypothetical protein B0H67DRAFT_678028 [Lasiosphaeris hirsuta]
MARVLRAKFDYVYQLALLSGELREIFARAPPIRGDDDADSGHGNGKRKDVDNYSTYSSWWPGNPHWHYYGSRDCY